MSNQLVNPCCGTFNTHFKMCTNYTVSVKRKLLKTLSGSKLTEKVISGLQFACNCLKTPKMTVLSKMVKIWSKWPQFCQYTKVCLINTI